MRYLVYYDPNTGQITRIVRSNIAPPEKYGTGPCLVVLSHKIITAETHHVVGGEVSEKE